jgi:hypothetical protein
LRGQYPRRGRSWRRGRRAEVRRPATRSLPAQEFKYRLATRLWLLKPHAVIRVVDDDSLPPVSGSSRSSCSSTDFCDAELFSPERSSVGTAILRTTSRSSAGYMLPEVTSASNSGAFRSTSLRNASGIWSYAPSRVGFGCRCRTIRITYVRPERPSAEDVLNDRLPRLPRADNYFFSASSTNSYNAFVPGSSGTPSSALILL